MPVQRTKDAFLNLTTGLMKDNTTGDISADDLRDLVESLAPSYGSFYISTPASTTVSVVDTWYKAAGTTTSTPTARNFTHANNKLTYNGAETVVAMVTGWAAWAAASGQPFLAVARNGAVLPGTTPTGSTGAGVSAATSTLVSLAPADYLELWVVQRSGTTDITAASGGLSVLTHIV